VSSSASSDGRPEAPPRAKQNGAKPATISVVLVTYQSAGEIKECIDSLRLASSTPLEFLIADNASTDGTQSICKQISEELNRQGAACELFLQTENLGFTRALNILLARADGDLILFLNPDTKGWSPGGLDCLARHLQASPSLGVVAPQLINVDGSVQSSCRRFPTPRDIFFEMAGLSRLFPRSRVFNGWKMGDFDHLAAEDVDQPQGACLLARREVVEQVGSWDERFPMFFSDVDWCRRVWEAGWRIRFVPEAKVVHHQGTSVHKRRAAMIWTSHKSFYDYLCKYHRGWRGQILGAVTGIALLVAAICRIAGYYLRRMAHRVER
jgi:hypothetical protein